MKTPLCKDRALAERLYPVYLANGTVEAVYDHCQKESIAISKPTLHKMADWFGWSKLREDAHRNQFAASPAVNGDPVADVNTILQEQKGELYRAMKQSPLNLDYHKALGTVIGQIMKAEELKLAANIDPRRVAGDVLEQLVEWLTENGNTEVAHELSGLLPLFAKERL